MKKGHKIKTRSGFERDDQAPLCSIPEEAITAMIEDLDAIIAAEADSRARPGAVALGELAEGTDHDGE